MRRSSWGGIGGSGSYAGDDGGDIGEKSKRKENLVLPRP